MKEKSIQNEEAPRFTAFSIFFLFYAVWLFIFIFNLFFPSSIKIQGEPLFILMVVRIFSAVFSLCCLLCGFLRNTSFENLFIYAFILSEIISLFLVLFLLFSVDRFETVKDIAVIIFSMNFVLFRVRENKKIKDF